MSDESEPTTLYVGGLDASVSHELLCTLFSQIGPVVACKVLREPGYDPYAFVDFASHRSASTALTAMNGRTFLGKEMKVNWASTPDGRPRIDTSSHYHVFVGDLSPEVSSQALREAFTPFGEISACRIVRDAQTLKSKGYAFVSFAKRTEAEAAIVSMNGQWLGSRCIRTNWSTRRPPPPQQKRTRPVASLEDILSQTSPSNSTVYLGNCPDVSDNLVQQIFSPYGEILATRVFRDKGYAFIKFSDKESAARAISSLNNTQLNGRTIKCFWGKECGDMKSTQTWEQQQQQQPQPQAFFPPPTYPPGMVMSFPIQYQPCYYPQQPMMEPPVQYWSQIPCDQFLQTNLPPLPPGSEPLPT